MTTGSALRKMLWSILVIVVLFIIFLAVDYYDGTTDSYYVGGSFLTPERLVTTPLAWAPEVSALVAILAGIYIFYILAPYAVYDHAKRHGRNAVRWTTAFVVFTPFVSCLVSSQAFSKATTTVASYVEPQPLPLLIDWSH